MSEEEVENKINQTITNLLPNIIAQAIDAMRNQGGKTFKHEDGDEYVEKKARPLSFSTAVEAENWITHIEKIYRVLGCEERFWVPLAVYKLEGDAQHWWISLRQAKGGIDFEDSLDWADFKELFFRQYFSEAEKEVVIREYANIKQGNDESINDFTKRFLRLVGLIGAAAGSAEDQARKYKWAVHGRYRSKMINLKCFDVVEAADYARNLEMERTEYLNTKNDEGKNKRVKIAQPLRSVPPPTNKHGQQSGNQGYRGNNWNNRGNQLRIDNGPNNNNHVISAPKAQKLISHGCVGYLASIQNLSIESPSLENIDVVREFPDVFPDELQGLPPVREVEFLIDLIPGSQPISKAPYRMAPLELQELKEQLQELIDCGFIRPSVSP
ncbi:uncharacterized protein [Rutidosis leptorrhynchoides]|uniref:uncharacterized protein n=1 Tax=Rutidosis leptorrhynchoides TaxID=125765 RepID=UPI003A9971D4